MWNLEFALLFGIPGNKIELSDGRSDWRIPFRSHELAEAQFENWIATLSRWKQASPRPISSKSGSKTFDVGGIHVTLDRHRVEFTIPFAWEAFEGLLGTAYDPLFWPGSWPERHRHWRAQLDHQDVGMNVYRLFMGWCERHGGTHCGRVDTLLSDVSVVAPDECYYRESRTECLVNDGYFLGPPDLVVEVMAPATALVDRGPRQEVYRRAGVPHLWLFDPALETMDAYELQQGQYHRQRSLRPGDTCQSPLFADETFAVADFFETQMKRHPRDASATKPQELPSWLFPQEFTLGLEHFFLLGHPDHRWEIWNNRCQSVLAFGSEVESRFRFEQFVAEAAKWTGKDNGVLQRWLMTWSWRS